jgi:GntR family transcriptional regulator, transcriptional repressor for pyruvate dehydrogenase complex
MIEKLRVKSSEPGVEKVVPQIQKINPIQMPSMADRIVAALIEYICESDLKDGDKLPTEKELSQSFEVGNRSLREALMILQSLGLIQARRGAGWYMKTFDPGVTLGLIAPLLEKQSQVGDAELVIQARLLNEPTIARLAAANIHATGLYKLEDILGKMVENAALPYLQDFRKYDRMFHMILAEECGNRILNMTSMVMHRMYFSPKWWLPGGDFDRLLRHHKNIFEAVKSGNGTAAEQCMIDHLNDAMKTIKSTLNQETAP